MNGTDLSGQRVLVVSHDAGGAEIVSSWVKKKGGSHFKFLLEGPAIKVFSKKIEGLENLDRRCLEASALRQFDFVLTGSGYISDLEKKAVRAARAAGVSAATYLDHWTCYEARFIEDGKLVLPDEIWVGDAHAYKLATEKFPGVKIRLEPNIYWEEVSQIIKGLSSSERGRTAHPARVLYCCEPISEAYKKMHGDPDYAGYTEYAALEGYLEYLAASEDRIEMFRLRLHPSEPPGKYDSIIQMFRKAFPIEQNIKTSLIEDCAWADWVAGCETMALVIALLAKKKVFSVIPKGGKSSSLPFDGIVRIFNDESHRQGGVK